MSIHLYNQIVYWYTVFVVYNGTIYHEVSISYCICIRSISIQLVYWNGLPICNFLVYWYTGGILGRMSIQSVCWDGIPICNQLVYWYTGMVYQFPTSLYIGIRKGIQGRCILVRSRYNRTVYQFTICLYFGIQGIWYPSVYVEVYQSIIRLQIGIETYRIIAAILTLAFLHLATRSRVEASRPRRLLIASLAFLAAFISAFVRRREIFRVVVAMKTHRNGIRIISLWMCIFKFVNFNLWHHSISIYDMRVMVMSGISLSRFCLGIPFVYQGDNRILSMTLVKYS